MFRRIFAVTLVGILLAIGFVLPSLATSHLQVGVHEKWIAPDYGRTPTQVKVRFPGSNVGRAFVNGVQSCGTNLRPKADNVLNPYFVARTAVVYLSIKTDPEDTAAGLCNNQIAILASHLSLKMNQYPETTIKFIWYHEPEDDMTGTLFASAFNRIRPIVHTYSSNRVKIVYSSMAWQWRPGSSRTSVPSQWRAVVADEYTSDVYSGRSYELGVILPEHPGFARWLAELVGNRPYGITERGFETPSSTNPTVRYQLRNDTITREFAWLKNTPAGQRCQTYIYWNSSGTEESQGLRLDPTGETRLATEIQNL